MMNELNINFISNGHKVEQNLQVNVRFLSKVGPKFLSLSFIKILIQKLKNAKIG